MKSRIVWWILTVGCAVLILGLSFQSVSSSVKVSGTITNAVLEQNTAYKEAPPVVQQIKNDELHVTLRSNAHIVLFAVLTFCASMLAKCYTRKWWLVISVPSCMVFAVLDECVQHVRKAGRAFELSDIYRDWLGVLIGIAVAVAAVIVSMIYHRKKLEESSHGVSGTGT